MTNEELVIKLKNNKYITAEEWLSIGPICREAIALVYDQKIALEDRFDNKFWAEIASRCKETALKAFDNGEVVYVKKIDDEYDHGYVTEIQLYSDGSTKRLQYYDGD